MALELAVACRRLHLGCGRTILPGWINLDLRPDAGVDVVADLDNCRNASLPFADNSIGEFLGSHLLEHLRDPLPFMEEIHRIAKRGARAVFQVPYGSSDDAFEDPTHVRPYFIHSFHYFSQPIYWRADYGYRGDWHTERVTLVVKSELRELPPSEMMHAISTRRNVVRQMTARLRAIKPIREPLRELIVQPEIEIVTDSA